MLQSNEGKIRVFPAVPAAWDSIPMAFILLARGAFLVSASRNNSAEVTQVGVKSLKGNLCRLQNPWGDKKCGSVEMQRWQESFRKDRRGWYWLSLPKQVKSMLFGSLVRKLWLKKCILAQYHEGETIGKKKIGKG